MLNELIFYGRFWVWLLLFFAVFLDLSLSVSVFCNRFSYMQAVCAGSWLFDECILYVLWVMDIWKLYVCIFLESILGQIYMKDTWISSWKKKKEVAEDLDAGLWSSHWNDVRSESVPWYVVWLLSLKRLLGFSLWERFGLWSSAFVFWTFCLIFLRISSESLRWLLPYHAVIIGHF